MKTARGEKREPRGVRRHGWRFRRTHGGLVACLALVAALFACGGNLDAPAATGPVPAPSPSPSPTPSPTPSPATPARFAYVTNQVDNSLSAYRVDASTGALTAVAGSPFRGVVRPTSLRVDPAGRFLFVTSLLGEVHVCAIDATTGALPAVAASSLAVAPQPFALAIDAAGKFAYVVQPVSGQATVFAVDAHSGALTQTWETAQAPGRFPRAIALTL